MEIIYFIEIGGYIFRHFISVEVVMDKEKLTDTCKISLPKEILYEGKTVSEIIKPDDQVIVKVGYDDTLSTIFTGAVRKIGIDNPIIIDCEDSMYLLKKYNSPDLSAQEISLSQLLVRVLPKNIEFNCPNFTLKNIKIVKNTAAQVLDFLRKNFGFNIFFSAGILFVEFTNLQELEPIVNIPIYDFDTNIIDYSSLTLESNEDKKFYFECFSFSDSEQRISANAGDPSGEKITKYYTGLSQGELQKIADNLLKNYQFNGFSGSFKAPLKPLLTPKDFVKITDSKGQNGGSGIYSIKSVTVTLDNSGLYQVISPAQKVAN